MQDRYTGDVGDFGKLGLLRWLCGVRPAAAPHLRLGIVWYMVPDESHNGDGKHVSYLMGQRSTRERYRSCDPDLYDRLDILVTSGNRCVRGMNTLGLLPASTVHVLQPLSFDGQAREHRLRAREDWLARATLATADCDLVFVDPDNGLETPSVAADGLRGPKFALFSDLKPFLDRQQSLVVYQHAHRSGSAEAQAHRRLIELRDKLGVDHAWAVRFARGSARLYLVIPSAAHAALLWQRTSELLLSKWGRHGHFHPVQDPSAG